MKKIFVLVFVLCFPTWLYAIALNGTGVQIGTDKSTTSFATSGMNTTPTKEIGTDNSVVNPNAPFSQPAYSPKSLIWAPAPTYQGSPPPSSSSIH